MATSGMISRANPINHRTIITSPADDIFEMDDSEVWSSSYQLVAVVVPNKKLPSSSVREFNASGRGGNRAPVSSSLPVNIPEWSKLIKVGPENGRWKRSDVMSDGEEENEEKGSYADEDNRIPPHEYLAMRRGASFSVHEGVGRTLKGRDLRQMRNAVWEKVGFED